MCGTVNSPLQRDPKQTRFSRPLWNIPPGVGRGVEMMHRPLNSAAGGKSEESIPTIKLTSCVLMEGGGFVRAGQMRRRPDPSDIVPIYFKCSDNGRLSSIFQPRQHILAGVKKMNSGFFRRCRGGWGRALAWLLLRVRPRLKAPLM